MWSYWRYTQRLLATVGDAENREQGIARRGGARGPCQPCQRGLVELVRGIEIGRAGDGTVVDGRLVDEGAIRNLGHDLAVVLDAQDPVVHHVADVRRVQIPLLEDRFDLGFAPLLDDEEHAFLRFGEHDFVRRHAGLALRHAADVDLDAAAAARAHLGGRAGQPGRAHVLHADERVGLHQLEAGFEQELLHERIADLHRRPLLGRLLVELGRRHRGAVDAVAAGLGADVVDRVADARGIGQHQRIGLGNTEAEDVDERVARVRIVEGDLAADRGDADAVAVAGDAGDHPLDDAAVAGAVRTVERSEAQASS